jgi:putative transposase
LRIPRDRQGTFEPVTVPKHQRRLDGLAGNVISLYAKGLTTGDIQQHLLEIYGTEVSHETISKITDQIVDEMVAWQSRPLDPLYAVLLIDCLVIKARGSQVANRPVYVAIGVNLDGERDVLGLWLGPSGGEGAKQWATMLTELRNRVWGNKIRFLLQTAALSLSIPSFGTPNGVRRGIHLAPVGRC